MLSFLLFFISANTYYLDTLEVLFFDKHGTTPKPSELRDAGKEASTTTNNADS